MLEAADDAGEALWLANCRVRVRRAARRLAIRHASCLPEACWAGLAGRGRCRLQLASAASASARRPGGLLHPPPSSAEADQVCRAVSPDATATHWLRRRVDST